MKLLDIKLWLALSLTLGLAPFFDEPHLIGKLKWIWGGAKGMQLLDWLDFLMHLAPWILLIISIIVHFQKRKKRNANVV